jgi:2-methylisocitrate lyase-like PEP mutase family enzyme
MSTINEKAIQFRSLHVRGQPLVLFNVWDVGSAHAVVTAGAQALATGSWSVANANGYADGECMPLNLALDNVARIVRSTDLPVTVDLERGYGTMPEEVAATIGRSIDAGAVGCNLEDSVPGGGALRDIAEQVARLVCARQAAESKHVPFFINLRTDVFFVRSPEWASDDDRVKEVLRRARAYKEAGADGLFVPGLTDAALIQQIAAASPLPLNIMVMDQTPPLGELARLGVARVSHGPRPYVAAMKCVQENAQQAMRGL